ncbi:MAG: (Fe-S)-binding protein [Acidaminobacteraceae bacterium]
MKIHLNNEYFAKVKLYHESCIDCGRCLKCCPIIDKDGRKPKTFLENLIMPSDVEFMDSISCLRCGYCKSVCPMSVDIGELLYELKMVNVKFSRDKKYRRKYRVIESHQKNLFRSMFINSTENKRVFFPGCSLSASNPSLVKELSRILEKDDIGLFSGCCASPSSISGDIDLFNKNRDKIKKEFEDNKVEEVIVACSNCYMALQNIDNIKVSSLYKVLEDGDLLDVSYRKPDIDSEFIIHDPCPTRFEEDIQSSARYLLEKSGIKFNEFKYNRSSTSCCGEGSMVSVLDTDMSKHQLSRRVSEAKEVKIISYCQTCVNNFKSQNNDSSHILELLINSGNRVVKEKSTLGKWSNRYRISKYVNELK